MQIIEDITLVSVLFVKGMDELLKKVAHILSGCIRAYDTLARLSGDEFVIIITKT